MTSPPFFWEFWKESCLRNKLKILVQDLYLFHRSFLSSKFTVLSQNESIFYLKWLWYVFNMTNTSIAQEKYFRSHLLCLKSLVHISCRLMYLLYIAANEFSFLKILPFFFTKFFRTKVTTRKNIQITSKITILFVSYDTFRFDLNCSLFEYKIE